MLAQTTTESANVIPSVDWFLLTPLVVLAVGGILLITLSSVFPRLRAGGFPAGFTILTAVVAGGFLTQVWQAISVEGPSLVVANAMAIDFFTLFVWGTICLAVFFTAAFFDGYLRRESFDGPEWYVLLLMSASGGMILSASQDLILSFVGLEILSIAVYVLAGLHLRRNDSQEAAFKYFILGALSSALFLYGIALVYGATGTTWLPGIAFTRTDNAAGLNPLQESSMILAGMALLLIGFGFKVSAVPFHLWTPDVYEGAPSPVVAFMASGVKVAGFAGMIRVFWQGFGFYVADWQPIISVLAIASLVVGSFLAIAQTNVKRMLAYSSITHAGFMLVAVHGVPYFGEIDSSDGQLLGGQALIFYFLAYTLMVAGTFGVASIVSGKGDDAHSLDEYRGLAKTSPVLAGLMVIFLLAQAGIPFTIGFWAKFRVIVAAVQNESYILAGVAMLAAVVAAVLYLRIIVSMFLTEAAPAIALAIDDDALEAESANSDDLTADESDVEGGAIQTDPLGPIIIPRAGLAAVVIAAVATLLFGLLPGLGSGVLADAAEALVFLRG